MANGNGVDPQEIARLANIHVIRYTRRLEAAKNGATNVRPEECEEYLSIWKSIQAKGKYELLNSQERLELQEAIESGE